MNNFGAMNHVSKSERRRFKMTAKMKGMCRNKTGPPKRGGRLTKDEKNDTAREKLQWKVSCDTKERSREANETNRRKALLCRGNYEVEMMRERISV